MADSGSSGGEGGSTGADTGAGASSGSMDGSAPTLSRDGQVPGGDAAPEAGPELPEKLLEGSKTIRDAEDIADLAGYTGLTGNLTIQTPSLMTLEGLQALRTVGGDLYIQSSSSLVSVEGLRGLVSVAGDLGILSNSALASLGGFSKLKSVGGLVSIERNLNLSTAAIEIFLKQIVAGSYFYCDNRDDEPCDTGDSSS